jgi:two-component system, sensor histidine kinase
MILTNSAMNSTTTSLDLQPSAATAPTKRRRFKAVDLPDNLDMAAIGQLFLGITLPGYTQLLADVFARKSGSLDLLLGALDAGQIDTLRQPAHSFKGEAGTLGLKKLAELAHLCELEGVQFSAERCQQIAAELRESWDTAHALCQRMGLVQA